MSYRPKFLTYGNKQEKMVFQVYIITRDRLFRSIFLNPGKLYPLFAEELEWIASNYVGNLIAINRNLKSFRRTPVCEKN